MHEHNFITLLSTVRDGESVDEYFTCVCGHIRHVYTFAPGNIRHINDHKGDSWTSGYAHGLRRIK